VALFASGAKHAISGHDAGDTGCYGQVKWNRRDQQTLTFRWQAPRGVKLVPSLPEDDTFHGPLDYWGRIRAEEEEIEYFFTVSNPGEVPWSANMAPNICLSPRDHPQFVDPKSKHILVCQDGEWINASRGELFTRLEPRWSAKQQYPRLEQIVVRVSQDGQWVVGNANDHCGSISWNPLQIASCLHAIPNVGAVQSHRRVTIRGKFYVFRGTLDELFERYKRDFGLLNP